MEFPNTGRSLWLALCLSDGDELTLWSYSQGFIDTIAFQKYSRSSSVRAIGESTGGTPSCPGMLVPFPIFGILPVEHLMVYMPA